MVEQRIFLQDIIYDGEDYSVRKSVSVSRAEAIDRMELAMKKYAQDAEIYTDKDLARVALNALLVE